MTADRPALVAFDLLSAACSPWWIPRPAHDRRGLLALASDAALGRPVPLNGTTAGEPTSAALLRFLLLLGLLRPETRCGTCVRTSSLY